MTGKTEEGIPKEISPESFPLLQRRLSSSSSYRRKTANGLDARKVLQSKPSGVIGEEDVATDQDMVRKANLRNIFFPFNIYYKIWWGITVIGAIATSFFLPYEIAFQEGYGSFKDAGAIVEFVLELIFSIDIIINFNLAVYKEGRLIFTRSEIVQSYLNEMFWLDLCGVFPFESLMLWFTGGLGQDTSDVLIYSIFRLPRLLRLRRLKKFSDIMQYDGHVSFLWFTLLRNMAAVLVFAHWEACTMYFIARLHGFSQDTWLGPLVTAAGDEKSTFDLYLTSLYLSVVTFCTVGYGDFSPVNSIEKLVGSFFMLCNIVVAAWIIGSITLLIVKGDEKTGQYRDNLDSLQQYGHMHQFDDNFMKMLKSQLKLGFQNQEISDEQVLKSFPSTVRRKILRKLYLKSLLRTQLMKGVRPQFVDAFLASCKVEIFSPGEEIVERGSILSELYLLVGGVAEVTNYEAYFDVEHGLHTYDEDDSMKIRFEAGDFIGEIGFFTESPQVESVTCLTVCKTLTISQTNYKMLENDHPGSIGKILKNLLAKVEETPVEVPLPEKLPILRAGSIFAYPLNEVESQSDSSYGGVALTSSIRTQEISIMQKETLIAVRDLIQMHMSKQLDDQTTRLLYAASRGDTATISLICESSFDPNHGDYDNRTALMVASMKGNTEVCRLLLNFKADPNLEDMHGSTALLEAVKNGHEETVHLLVKNGAKISMKESLAASILCQAVYDGDITLLRRLVDAGVWVNAADYDKRTAAHIAAAEGNLSAFQILVNAGANLQGEDRWGNTPKDEALRHGSTRILNYLNEE